MAPSDEPEDIVVQVTDDRAIVIGAPSGTERSRWGRWISDFTSSELASLVRTLDPATQAFIEAKRLAAHWVELDPTSRAMWPDLKKITEPGGWIQGTLRDDQNRYARVIRIRPVTGAAALSGAVGILGAITAQAQTAEMARDIKDIRQRVNEIYAHLQSDQIGAVEHVVERVEDLVERLRVHGEDGVRESEFSVIGDRLGDARRKCMGHLKDSVRKLESVKQHRSSRKSEKSLSAGAVEEVMLYLDLLSKLYAASVQFGFAEVAFDHHEGRGDVARTRAERTIESIARFHAELEDVCGRLGQLDESVRARFGLVKRRVWPAAVSRAVMITDIKSIRVPVAGVSIPIPGPVFAGVGGVLLSAVVEDVEARAEKKLDDRLLRLTEASSSTSECMNRAAGSLEVLRTLTDEFAGFGE
ncbi:hypothetical protein ABZ865_41725 [Streptomyces sp. NPDC047085]|uniref:hypothetical protein n=1 Tax=Streptomyces sp. NPDC047085 TaxID=3155140 RepID=UPI0033CE6184